MGRLEAGETTVRPHIRQRRGRVLLTLVTTAILAPAALTVAGCDPGKVGPVRYNNDGTAEVDKYDSKYDTVPNGKTVYRCVGPHTLQKVYVDKDGNEINPRNKPSGVCEDMQITPPELSLR